MSKSKKIFLTVTPALLLSSLESHAQLKKVEGISTQVSALRNAMQSLSDGVNNELASLSASMVDLKSEAAQTLQQQYSAQNCANSRMLYNGTQCIALPQASAPPPSSMPTVTASAPSPQSSCTASPELCAIYDAELGRAPDQAGAHFWQNEMDRLQNSGLTAQQAAEEVRQHISGSNEATTGAMSTAETIDYINYANTHNISNPTASCASGTQC